VVSVGGPARAITLAALAATGTRRPVVVAVPTSADGTRLANDLAAYLGPEEIDYFPAWETLPFERISPSVETMGHRLRVMWRLRRPQRSPSVLVAPVRSLVQRLGPHVEDADPIVVELGSQIEPEALVRSLVNVGYRSEPQVEHRGEVARRGSIVDVFPSTAAFPVRIDLWGDEVDRLTRFSVADQRSLAPVERVELFGCREVRATPEVRARAAELVGREPWGREQWERIAEGLVFDGMESWLPWVTETEHVLFDLLGPQSLVVVVEPRRMRDRAGELASEEAALAASLAQTWGAAGDRDWPRLHVAFDRLLSHTGVPVTTIDRDPRSDGPAVETRAWEKVAGEPGRLPAQLAALVAEGYRVVVAADTQGSATRVAAVLGDAGVSLPIAATATTGSQIVVASLEQGFILPEVKLAVLVEADLTGRRRPHRQPRSRRRDAQGFFDDLNPGDYVVHHHHGVARYGGMVQRAIGGAARDYLLLEYKGGDKLYIPSDQIDSVRHYTGGESPTLSRLGGSDWARTKARVRSAAREVAEELVVLYRTRTAATGHAFAPDSPWQTQMEDRFGFIETPDQDKAITDVKTDMEEATPMDRLVCGDVGFGKTEVAIRAAFKAVQDGKQVAILVPTTLLAQQHFATFTDRYAGFPMRVEVLSRFLTSAQARSVVEGLESGAVDVVVGTHRLLSADVKFKNLGLLVIDEEQRFGVTAKEAIKAIRANVDVLTLTATPIPRTLEMSLTGIRDLTILNTPPADRQPILTYVGEYDERAVSEALRRELLREGQVFFVHNRISDIEATATKLREMVPDARVAVAHGQMDEGQLERVVLDFWQGDYDVLVCTTIIESGIDMPTVNTLIVDRADLMGLGQLHQLRGRVGRSGQRAYAYLFFPPDRALSETAYERLRTIGDYTELGSGFKIAMRDLEIRGAGNLLGGSQSGHIAAVGYDLYVAMVSEAVADLKGESQAPPPEVRLDLPGEACLPGDYVASGEARLEAYRRLAAVRSAGDVDDVRQEWSDRFGPPPAPARALLAVARLRAECLRLGVSEVAVSKVGSAFGPQVLVARVGPLRLLTSQRIRLARLVKTSTYVEETGYLSVPFTAAAVEAKGGVAAALVELLAELCPPLIGDGASGGPADAPNQAGSRSIPVESATP